MSPLPNDQENKCDASVTHHRPNDIWISATMLSVLLSVVGGVMSIKNTLTEAAVSQEARFTRIEEQVKALREDVIEQKEIRYQRGSNGYSSGDATK